MTQRKPSDLSFESWIEQQIREAQADGRFENLPGHGRPLANLREADDPLWWAKQLVRREGLDVLPPALEIERTVERTLAALPAFPSEAKLREALARLNDDIRRVNRFSTGGPPTTQPVLDVEALVAEWRSQRDAATATPDAPPESSAAAQSAAGCSSPPPPTRPPAPPPAPPRAPRSARPR
jgi:hypothetical protein